MGATTRHLRGLCVALVCASAPALALASGCGAPPLELSYVEPTAFDVDTGGTLTVHGSGFNFSYNAFVDQVSATFAIALDDDALAEVRWVDASTLRGDVPAGLAPGLRDVVVTTSDGSATLKEAVLLR